MWHFAANTSQNEILSCVCTQCRICEFSPVADLQNYLFGGNGAETPKQEYMHSACRLIHFSLHSCACKIILFLQGEHKVIILMLKNEQYCYYQHMRNVHEFKVNL